MNNESEYKPDISEVKPHDVEGQKSAEKRKRLKRAKDIGAIALFGGGIVLPWALDYIDTYRDVSGVLQYEFTDKGENAITYIVDKVDSAADAVTGIFSTAPDDNGESIKFTIDTIDNVTKNMGIEPYDPAEDAAGMEDFYTNGGIEYHNSDNGSASTPESGPTQQRD